MIVHVWRRAMEADAGAVVVATDAHEVRDAICKAGGEAIMTRADHPSGSDRVFEAATRARSGRQGRRRRQCAGRPADARPRAGSRLHRGARRPACRYRHDRRRDRPRGGAHRSERGEGGRHAHGRGPMLARALFHPRDRALTARARSTIISASTPIAGERWSGSSRCRRRRSSSARSWSSSARSKPACASMSALVDTVPLGVDTPRDLERARELLQSRP